MSVDAAQLRKDKLAQKSRIKYLKKLGKGDEAAAVAAMSLEEFLADRDARWNQYDSKKSKPRAPRAKHQPSSVAAEGPVVAAEGPVVETPSPAKPRITSVADEEEQEREYLMSREQAEWANDVLRDPDFDFDEAYNLPSIPARLGFVQKWVRVNFPHSKEVDPAHLTGRNLEGWLPRNAQTVSDKWRGLKAKGRNLVEHDIIVCSGMVLMERREELHQHYAEAKRRKGKRFGAAVEKELMRDVPNSRVLEHRSTVSIGRHVAHEQDE